MDALLSPPHPVSSPSSSRRAPTGAPKSSSIPPIKLVHPNVHTFAHVNQPERDVEAEIDELMSDDEAGSEQVKRGSGGWRCKWGNCPLAFDEQERLVHHIHTDHIGGGKDVYICEWSDCLRKGQKQATRHSLITHCRAHTGERPYTCSVPACGKTFTRSDAMNKHLRSLHGIITEPPNKKKPKDPPSALTQRPLPAAEQAEWMRSNDLDLIEDEEVAEVLPRVRRREMFWTTSEDDERLVKMVRDRYPRGLGKLKGRAEDGSEDSFDEGVGGRCDLGPKVENLMTDPEDGKEVELMTRPGWQIKFIMAKAKLMLVEEENAMRRRELAELMVLERKMQTGEV